MPIGEPFRPGESYEQRQFRLDDEARFAEARDHHNKRADAGLTVQKETRVVAVCDRCSFERRYVEGAENLPCPSCGGKSKGWKYEK